jgi:amino acid adenylation domain-containing protein
VDGEPAQVIDHWEPQKVALEDLTKLPQEEREEEARRITREEARTGFDLKQSPLIRVKVLKLAEEERLALFTIHHIVSDGWSMGILIREVKTLYHAYSAGEGSPLEELPIQYADFAVWQRLWLKGEVLERELDYWRKQLAGMEDLELPTDHPRLAAPDYRGASRRFVIEKKVAEKLRELCQQERVTLFMTLLGGFDVLMNRYSGQEDVALGTDIANRNRAEIEGLIGFFVNQLVMRVMVRPAESFSELLKQVREVCLGAYAHQDVPFEKLVEELRPERDLSRSPLFQVKLILQNMPREGVELAGLKLSDGGGETQPARFDLTITVVDEGREMMGAMNYSCDLFEEETIDRLMRHYTNLLREIAEGCARPISSLSLLSEGERAQIVVGWNETERAYQHDRCIHELFVEQVERGRERVALIDEAQQLSYRELNRRANQLAHYLQKLGVGPEMLVGIYLERSVEMVVAVLGALKAGGAYLPLDPAYPMERLGFMLEDASVGIVLTEPRLENRLPVYWGQVICLEQEKERISAESEVKPVSDTTPENLAYVIYTSGSTGQPKGVMVRHRGLTNYLCWAQKTYLPEQGSVVSSSLSFDATITSLVTPLICGGKITLLPEHQEINGLKEQVMAAAGCGLVKITPSHLEALGQSLVAEKAGGSVGMFIIGGEALPPSTVELWRRIQPDARLINEYGPTETVVGCVACEIPLDAELTGSVPIGRPIANTRIYLLDRHLQPMPVGVAGEIYIGGAGVSRGYLNRPELTADRFMADPFTDEPGERMYKTGDMACYQPDGTIRYLGRNDSQVKLRGFRIELGEIEARLAQHPAIREAVVLVREDHPADQRLVAYYAGEEVGDGELREYLSSALPDYMIPAAYVRLESLPLTPNGKLDRKALPAPDMRKSKERNGYPAPQTPLEQIVAGIFEEVLKLDRVGVHDNFFELGGHSLLATQVASRMWGALGVEVGVRSLFEEPTVEKLARCAERLMKAEPPGGAPPLVRRPRDGKAPLSFAQQRLWFLDQLAPNNPTYNIPVAVKLEGQLKLEVLQRVLGEIVRRHEALRTRFEAEAGVPLQTIDDWKPQKLECLDLTGLSSEERAREVGRIRREEEETGFDLRRGPLLRVKVVKLGEEEYLLLYTMHHIVGDGWSIGILINEVGALYQAYSGGGLSPLDELPIQYADFAVWQRAWLQGEALENQLDYWRRHLGGELPALELPTDKPRPAVQTYHGAERSRMLPITLSDSLKTLSLKQSCTLFMTLLSAFKILLYYLTGQTDICVGTDIANRNRAEIEKLIGFFVNQLALRSQLSPNSTFEELLRKEREITLGAYAHQDLPFEKLVEALNPKRDANRTPLFQVNMTLQNAPVEELSLPGLKLSQIATATGATSFDLILNLYDTAQGLGASLHYNTDLFEERTSIRILNRFHTLLDRIVERPDARLNELVESLIEEDKREEHVRDSELESVRLQGLKNIKRKAISELSVEAQQ